MQCLGNLIATLLPFVILYIFEIILNAATTDN